MDIPYWCQSSMIILIPPVICLVFFVAWFFFTLGMGHDWSRWTAPGMLRMHMNTCMHGSVTCAGTETWRTGELEDNLGRSTWRFQIFSTWRIAWSYRWIGMVMSYIDTMMDPGGPRTGGVPVLLETGTTMDSIFQDAIWCKILQDISFIWRSLSSYSLFSITLINGLVQSRKSFHRKPWFSHSIGGFPVSFLFLRPIHWSEVSLIIWGEWQQRLNHLPAIVADISWRHVVYDPQFFHRVLDCCKGQLGVDLTPIFRKSPPWSPQIFPSSRFFTMIFHTWRNPWWNPRAQNFSLPNPTFGASHLIIPS